MGGLEKERFVLRGGTLRFVFSERFVLRIIRVDISHDKWWKSGDELIKASGNQALPSEEEAGGQVVDRAKHSR